MKLPGIQFNSLCLSLIIVNLIFLSFGLQAGAVTLLSADFDANSEGFTYSDDTFRSTNNPTFASGSHSVTGGFTGGRISVTAGGVNGVEISNGMSGGWSSNFVVSGTGTVSVTLTLRYRLIFSRTYEVGECGQALVTVDGVLRSPVSGQDFLQQFCGSAPQPASNRDSGWQQVTINLNLSPGTHTLAVGGWNNMKTSANEFTDAFFDNIVISQGDVSPTPTPTPSPTPSPSPSPSSSPSPSPSPPPSATLLSANFDVGADGFTYSDDTFRGTNQPNYANGTHNVAGGFSGGRINAFIGGVDNTAVSNMSGGWSRGFMVSGSGAQSISITLRYRLFITQRYESGECGQALLAIDGTLISQTPGQDFLQQFCGATPNVSTDQDSDWQQVTINLNLSAGTHTITVGGFNNSKNASNEFTNVLFDDIEIVQQDLLPSPTPPPPPATLFSDDFNDGNANGWTVINDSGKAPNWQVQTVGGDGKYRQLNSNIGKFVQSFHTGSFSFLNSGSSLTDYEVTVEVTQVGAGSVGLMFRHQNNGNYYRVSLSATQGFARLEKKVSGTFTTLVFNLRGPVLNQAHTIKVDVKGSKIFVQLDGEPLFSAIDSSFAGGTIALYTQDNAVFDNVVITENSLSPKVVISNPTSYFVGTAVTGILNASAVATNVPPGGGVRFALDGVSSPPDFTEPYAAQFSGVSTGDHTVGATIVDSASQPVSGAAAQDTNISIGVGGNYCVGMGDSITNGVGDDFPDDNGSFDGRTISRGYTPILNDLLSSGLNIPVTIANEGLGGTKSGSGAGHGVSRVNSTRARHAVSQHWLILFGTNDSAGSLPVPSGKGLNPGDSGYAGSFKDNMQRIITNLRNSGKIPLLAKVPFVRNAPSMRNQIIQDYNIAVDELVSSNNISVTPPDFYNYFSLNQDEFADDLHPNGNGYISIANCWFAALCQSGILGISQPCPPNPCN